MIKVKSYIYFFLISFLIITSQKISSQWSYIYQNSNTYYGYFSHISFLNPNTGIVVCADSSMMRTTNGGINWAIIAGTNNFRLNQIQFASTNNVYAVGNVGLDNSFLLKSSNTGLNWISQNFSFYIYWMDFVNDNTGYLTDDNGKVHKTTNGGSNWSIIDLSSNFLNFVDFIDINTGYVGTDHKIFRTTNGGQNWLEKASPSLWGFQFVNALTGFGTSGSYSEILFKTTNGGDTWVIIFQQQDIVLSVFNFINENTGWMTANQYVNGLPCYPKVYKTINSGINWFEQSTGFNSNDSSMCLYGIEMVDSNIGYFTSYSCFGSTYPPIRPRIYKTTNGGGGPIGIEPVNSNIPENYLLHQNYPNPFNPVTKISFEIPVIGSNASTSLTIYNITGSMISVLVDEQLQPGKYEIEWNASDFASGVYFYTLNSGNFKETRKMLMIK